MLIPIKQIIQEGYNYSDLLENVRISTPQTSNYLANNNTPQDRIGGLIGGVTNMGLPGGIVSAYGNITNKDRQYQALNQSKVESSNGAWDNSMIARGQFLNNMDNRASNLYDYNKAQYFLNPLTVGPIQHSLIKGSRDINNGVYKLLKNKQSPEINSRVTVVANPNGNPLNAGLDTIRNSANNYADEVAEIRRNNPGHYYLNPFVAGPVNEFIGGHLVGGVTQGIRKATTISGKSGDSLVHNIGRR